MDDELSPTKLLYSTSTNRGEEVNQARKSQDFFTISLHELYLIFYGTLIEFEVQGGTLFDLKRSGRKYTLRIVTSNGQKLGIVRNAEGGKQIETLIEVDLDNKFDRGF